MGFGYTPIHTMQASNGTSTAISRSERSASFSFTLLSSGLKITRCSAGSRYIAATTTPAVAMVAGRGYVRNVPSSTRNSPTKPFVAGSPMDDSETIVSTAASIGTVLAIPPNAKTVPMLAAVLTIVSLSSIGLPATNGFVGEFLVLLGTFRTYPLPATIATAGVVVAAMYLLPALQRVIFNPLDKSVNEKLADLSLREIAVLVPLLACIVWIGVYPKPILQRMEPSARQLIQSVRLNAASFTAVR